MERNLNYGGPVATLPPSTPEQFSVTQALRAGWFRMKGTKRIFLGLALGPGVILFLVNYISGIFAGDAKGISMAQGEIGPMIALSITSMILSPIVMALSTGIALQRTAGFAVRFSQSLQYLKHAPAIFVFTFFWEVASMAAVLFVSPTLGFLIRMFVAVLGIFVMYYIVDRQENPFRAFTLSGTLVMRNFGQTLFLLVVLVLIGLAIAVTLGVGAIWLGPLVALTMADLFRQAEGLQRVADYEEFSIG